MSEQRALDLFMEAEQAYEQGDIERAVELLLEARRLEREPVLLYNLARAYDMLSRLEEALDAYEEYLEEAPDAVHRGAIETRIDALRLQIEERDRRVEERSDARVTAPLREPTPPVGPSPIPWFGLATGIATLGGAIVSGLLSGDARNEAAQDPFYASASASFARAENLALVANILYATGGALSLAAAIWGTVDLATTSFGSSGQVTMHLQPGRVLLAGRW